MFERVFQVKNTHIREHAAVGSVDYYIPRKRVL